MKILSGKLEETEVEVAIDGMCLCCDGTSVDALCSLLQCVQVREDAQLYKVRAMSVWCVAMHSHTLVCTSVAEGSIAPLCLARPHHAPAARRTRYITGKVRYSGSSAPDQITAIVSYEYL